MGFIARIIKQAKCAHIYCHHRNIHGDEINRCGGKRSVWVCVRCDKVQWRDRLYYPDGSPELAEYQRIMRTLDEGLAEIERAKS